jgi:hypothetical protein
MVHGRAMGNHVGPGRVIAKWSEWGPIEKVFSTSQTKPPYSRRPPLNNFASPPDLSSNGPDAILSVCPIASSRRDHASDSDTLLG